MILLKEKENKKDNNSIVNKNFFKSMNYELAGEIGKIDNEDMINNRKVSEESKEEKS